MRDYRTVEVEDFMVTPEASRLIDKTWSMARLGLPKVWIFEGDDGPEHYQTCESLLDYLHDFGGRLIRLGSSEVELIHKESISSGTFLFQVD